MRVADSTCCHFHCRWDFNEFLKQNKKCMPDGPFLPQPKGPNWALSWSVNSHLLLRVPWRGRSSVCGLQLQYTPPPPPHTQFLTCSGPRAESCTASRGNQRVRDWCGSPESGREIQELRRLVCHSEDKTGGGEGGQRRGCQQCALGKARRKSPRLRLVPDFICTFTAAPKRRRRMMEDERRRR